MMTKMDVGDVERIVSLGKSDLHQFEIKLHDATKQRIEVWIELPKLMQLPDESILAYLSYLNTEGAVSSGSLTAIKESALQHVSSEKNLTEFRRHCRFLKHYKIDGMLTPSQLPSYCGYVDALWYNIVYKGFKCLTFEELDRLIDIRNGATIGVLNSEASLYSALENSDTRVFNFLHDRYLMIPESERVKSRFKYALWKTGEINSMSAIKLVKLEIDALGSTTLKDLDVFADWALLGYFTDTSRESTTDLRGQRLIDALTRGGGREHLRPMISNLVVEADRVISCLNSCLPKVLVNLVLQYLL